jgi:hypothetical protein
MSYEEYAYDEYLAELGYEKEIENAIRQVPIDNVGWYLATYGDALENRIKGLVAEAKDLLSANHPGPSLVVSTTSLEILIRYFVLKPLVYGAFLSDYWADLLVNRVVSGDSKRDRQLLPQVALEWEIDLEAIKITDGKQAWGVVVSDIVPKRNRFVHRGEPIQSKVSERAIECAEALFSGLLIPIAKKFELSWPESGEWHKVIEGVGSAIATVTYDPGDPFQ